jgi:hypothetical protein
VELFEVLDTRVLQDLILFGDLHRLDHFEGGVVERFGGGNSRLGHFLEQGLEQVHRIRVELETNLFEVEVQICLEVLVHHVVVVVAVKRSAACEPRSAVATEYRR